MSIQPGWDTTTSKQMEVGNGRIHQAHAKSSHSGIMESQMEGQMKTVVNSTGRMVVVGTICIVTTNCHLCVNMVPLLLKFVGQQKVCALRTFFNDTKFISFGSETES